MTEPSAPANQFDRISRRPIPSDSEVLDAARQILREYHADPIDVYGDVAVRRDLYILDRLDETLLPLADSRAYERHTLALLVGDRRHAFGEWLRELRITEAISLADHIEGFTTVAPTEVETSVAIIASVRKQRFESTAELVDRYRYLRAADAEIRTRIRVGLTRPDTPLNGLALTHAYQALDRAFVSGASGLSRFEQRCVLDWARTDLDLTDRSEADLLALLDPPGDGPHIPIPRSITGAQLADQVDELRVWRRLMTDEPPYPYSVRFAAGTRRSGATSRASETETRRWLAEMAEGSRPDELVHATVFRVDPATGEQRLCTQIDAMPAAEFTRHLQLLAHAEAAPTPTGDYSTDNRQLQEMLSQYSRATGQLNDPRRASVAFETIIHHDNLRHQIIEFAYAAGLPHADRHINDIDARQRLFREPRAEVSFLDERLTHLNQQLDTLRAAGRVDVTPPESKDLHFTAGAWSDDELGPWFLTAWSAIPTDLSDNTRYFTTVEELVDHFPVAPAAAQQLAELESQLAHAQALVDVTRAHLDTIRHATPVTSTATATATPTTTAGNSPPRTRALDRVGQSAHNATAQAPAPPQPGAIAWTPQQRRGIRAGLPTRAQGPRRLGT